MIKVALVGASGHMGRMLIDAIAASGDLVLAEAYCHKGAPEAGKEVLGPDGKPTGVYFSDDLAKLGYTGCDAVVDFSRPDGTMAILPLCAQRHIPLVIGTTGFSAEQKEKIQGAAKEIPVVLAPNMSKGVNVTFKLIAQAAKALPDYDCEIVEMHHSRKVDAPSGTAVEMARVIAEARGRKLEDVAVWTRHGHTGPRVKGTIGFAVLRGGDVVGDHRVIFAGKGERIEVAHLSSSREGYAQGALEAARFLQSKEAGFYTMMDVLGL